jgi:hypothetical protein
MRPSWLSIAPRPPARARAPRSGAPPARRSASARGLSSRRMPDRNLRRPSSTTSGAAATGHRQQRGRACTRRAPGARRPGATRHRHARTDQIGVPGARQPVDGDQCFAARFVRGAGTGRARGRRARVAARLRPPTSIAADASERIPARRPGALLCRAGSPAVAQQRAPHGPSPVGTGAEVPEARAEASCRGVADLRRSDGSTSRRRPCARTSGCGPDRPARSSAPSR